MISTFRPLCVCFLLPHIQRHTHTHTPDTYCQAGVFATVRLLTSARGDLLFKRHPPQVSRRHGSLLPMSPPAWQVTGRYMQHLVRVWGWRVFHVAGACTIRNRWTWDFSGLRLVGARWSFELFGSIVRRVNRDDDAYIRQTEPPRASGWF